MAITQLSSERYEKVQEVKFERVALQYLFWILSILTLGVFRLILYWSEDLYIRFRAYKCSLAVADMLLVM